MNDQVERQRALDLVVEAWQRRFEIADPTRPIEPQIVDYLVTRFGASTPEVRANVERLLDRVIARTKLLSNPMAAAEIDMSSGAPRFVVKLDDQSFAPAVAHYLLMEMLHVGERLGWNSDPEQVAEAIIRRRDPSPSAQSKVIALLRSECKRAGIPLAPQPDLLDWRGTLTALAHAVGYAGPEMARQYDRTASRQVNMDAWIAIELQRNPKAKSKQLWKLAEDQQQPWVGCIGHERFRKRVTAGRKPPRVPKLRAALRDKDLWLLTLRSTLELIALATASEQRRRAGLRKPRQ
jgi:hypothetical protein